MPGGPPVVEHVLRAGLRQQSDRHPKEHPMNGPSLTPQEAVTTVARRVRRLEAQGLDRDLAIEHTAVEFGIEPHKVRWSVETAFGESAVRVPAPSRRRPCPGAGRRIAPGQSEVPRAYA